MILWIDWIASRHDMARTHRKNADKVQVFRNCLVVGALCRGLKPVRVAANARKFAGEPRKNTFMRIVAVVD